MKFNHPLWEGPDGCPSANFGEGEDKVFITLECVGCHGNRLAWKWTITALGWEHSDSDLYASPQYSDDAEGTREAFCSLLTFLIACGESYPDGENATLFPAEVAEWAQAVQDELAVLRCEIEEDPTCIEDEEDS